MKLNNYIFGATLIVLLALWSIGCEDDHGDMMSNNGTSSEAIARVYPAEGAVGVPTISTIAIKFTGPMDTMSAMENIHLSYGQDMDNWMDSATHYGGMGQMSMDHMDHMMDWMDSVSMSGEFYWNEAMDSCEFVPDSAMIADQEHMILICEDELMDHGGGMMGGNQSNNEYSEHHFTTGH